MTPQAAIALGSNLGDRTLHLRAAIEHIEALGEILAISSFHDTTPVGYTDQPRFLNATLILNTRLEPEPLMHALLAIEQTMGRRRDTVPAKGPRIIDLDLLLYQDASGTSLTLTRPHLTLPHPAMQDRRFVLAPLAEIAPDWLHPTTGRTIAELLAALP